MVELSLDPYVHRKLLSRLHNLLYLLAVFCFKWLDVCISLNWDLHCTLDLCITGLCGRSDDKILLMGVL